MCYNVTNKIKGGSKNDDKRNGRLEAGRCKRKGEAGCKHYVHDGLRSTLNGKTLSKQA